MSNARFDFGMYIVYPREFYPTIKTAVRRSEYSFNAEIYLRGCFS